MDELVIAPGGIFIGGKPHLAPHQAHDGGRLSLAPNSRYVGSDETK